MTDYGVNIGVWRAFRVFFIIVFSTIGSGTGFYMARKRGERFREVDKAAIFASLTAIFNAVFWVEYAGVSLDEWSLDEKANHYVTASIAISTGVTFLTMASKTYMGVLQKACLHESLLRDGLFMSKRADFLLQVPQPLGNLLLIIQLLWVRLDGYSEDVASFWNFSMSMRILAAFNMLQGLAIVIQNENFVKCSKAMSISHAGVQTAITTNRFALLQKKVKMLALHTRVNVVIIILLDACLAFSPLVDTPLPFRIVQLYFAAIQAVTVLVLFYASQAKFKVSPGGKSPAHSTLPPPASSLVVSGS